jgi:uncharacterized pyridoxamine 5'-phosphate oxidase family protein
MNTTAKKAAYRFLKSHRLGVLSTVEGDQPHAAYMYYVANKDFSLYMVMSVATKKHFDMQQNHKVAFTVGTANPPCTIQLEGISETVSEPREIITTIDRYTHIALHASHYTLPITSTVRDNGLMVYKIQPTRVKWSDFSKSNKDEQVTIFPSSLK